MGVTCLDSGHILKIESKGYLVWLDVAYEQKKVVKDDHKVLLLSTYMDVVCIN